MGFEESCRSRGVGSKGLRRCGLAAVGEDLGALCALCALCVAEQSSSEVTRQSSR